MLSIQKIASKMIQSKGRALVVAGALIGGLTAASARAALTLTLSEPGFAPVTGTASGNTDTFFGSYGDFSTNIVVGFTNSATPSAAAELQIQTLNVINNNQTGTKALTISLTDTGYTFPGVPGQPLRMTSSIGGTLTSPVAGDTITFQSTATPTGGPVLSTSTPPQTYVAPTTTPGAVGFSVPDANVLFTQTGSYSLSNQLVLSLASSGETANLSGSTTVTAVPEPTILAAAAVAGLGLLRRRRRTA
jgi:MYXO-CTERM domain-containing protein